MPLLYSRITNVDAHPLNAIDFIHTKYTVTCRILSFLNYDIGSLGVQTFICERKLHY